MSKWIPDFASVKIEVEMEALDLPEEDRDEIRKFAEILRRRKDEREGKELPPLTEEMTCWLLGKDCVP